MIDISEKDVSVRKAIAKGKIKLGKNTIEAIKEKRIKKGDVLETAKIAAILAVKNTPGLVPLTHTIPVTNVDVGFRLEKDSVECTVGVGSIARTGPEMEALVGVMSALITVWDMVKSMEKDERGEYPRTEILSVKVTEKIKSSP
jgi:cyclic pyranopterin phosphate synthase